MQRRDRTATLTVDALDDRIVPAVIDLTHRGAAAEAAGALVRQVTDHGHWWCDDTRSFVRLRHGGAERGYNTNARPLQFDELRGRRVTHAITLGQVPRRTVDGAHYREFFLDVKQRHNHPDLSVDEIKVFLGGAGNLHGYHDGRLAGLDPVYDLDAGGDVALLVTDDLNRGRRADDMVLLVPEAAFAGASADTFVYLYSKMGGMTGARANGDFEEWGIKADGGGGPVDPPPPPPPAELSSLSGLVYVDHDGSFDLSTGDTGLGGVELLLTGTDDRGDPVSLSVVTNADGTYTFADLRPGTYNLFEMQPPGFRTVIPTELGLGLTDPGANDPSELDRVTGIVVGSGQTGTGFNYLEAVD